MREFIHGFDEPESNMKNETFTNIGILGGGPAGYVASIRAAQLGAKVTLIEEREIGGVCMNRGCIPTKALLRTSENAALIKKSKEFGIDSHTGDIAWGAAVNRKDRVVKNLNIGLEQLLRAKGVTIIKGRGSVESERKLIARTAEDVIEVNCEKIILATGASPFVPPVKGIDSEGVITSNEALSLDVLPENILIVGAGVIGLEFAGMMNSLGVKVTVVEVLERILPGTDEEIAAELLKIMKRQGVHFKLGATVKEIQESNGILAVTCSEKEKTFVQSCNKVLVAAGRKADLSAVKNLSLRIDNDTVHVNESMETSIKGVYAAGDLAGRRQLAHLAFMEGRVAAENALGINSRVNYNAVPSCVYTHPEVAAVGMAESDAKQAGLQVKVGRFDFRNNGRALTLGERDGFVKVIADGSGTIIGAQILGANASEIISELTLAITLKAKAADLADMIHPHPALSEAIWEACGEISGRAIHKL
jgi:dihydrolipoamide dehydrogenase